MEIEWKKNNELIIYLCKHINHMISIQSSKYNVFLGTGISI